MARWVLVFVALWCALPAWSAPSRPDCSNPKAAANSLFDHLSRDHYDPIKAATCLDSPPGADGARLAVQLLQVLDARGHYVPVAAMSSDPNYLEDDVHRHIPMPEDFPVLVLVRDPQGNWMFSRDTLDAVPDLYADTFSPLSLWVQQYLPTVFYTRILGLHLWQYLYGTLLVLVSVVSGLLASRLLRGQVRRMVDRSGLELDLRTYDQTRGPVVLVVMLAVLLWGFPDLQLTIGSSRWLSKLLSIAMWLTALVALSRFVNVGAMLATSWAGSTENRLDDQLMPLLRQAAQAVLWVAGGLYLADEIGLDVWKLAAGVGIGGLAFALAAQDTVANVFGSVNIFVDRPFQIGDWVKLGEVEGVVEEVGFRSTRVRTFYNSLVTIPNSQITNANVDNLGLRPRRRIKFTLGLTYDTPPDKVHAYVEGVRAILTAHPMVEATYEVHLYNLGASAIEILVYYHVIVPGWHDELVTRSQNILEFIRLAEAMGVSFAFPSQSLYLQSTPEQPLPPHVTPSIAELENLVSSFGPAGARGRPAGPGFTRDWSVQARGEASDRGSASDEA
ncbi:MAG: MscS family membrane protein [Myxococcota bacterium]|jgi:MscS family membrane protein